MSVLGVIARARAQHVDAVRVAITQIVGVDVALQSPDGRLILIIEDSAQSSAAAAMAEVAAHPLVLNTSLVYEYSGDGAADDGLDGYMAWRTSLKASSRRAEPVLASAAAGGPHAD
jgi:nitrate reductase NapAB chaperone NapD